MKDIMPSQRCKLVDIACTHRGELQNVTLTLRGAGLDVLRAKELLDTYKKTQPLLEKTYMEISDANREQLTITAAIEGKEDIIALAEAVHNATHCRLGGVMLEAVGEQMGVKSRILHVPVVIVTPQEHLKNPLLGEVSAQIIARGRLNEWVLDPQYPDPVRIIDLRHTYNNGMEAIIAAENMRDVLRKHYDLFSNRTADVRLRSVRTSVEEVPFQYRQQEGRDVTLAGYAMLEGDEKALSHAHNAIKHRLPKHSVKLHRRGDDNVEYVSHMHGSEEVAAAVIAGGMHSATGCALPVHANPHIARYRTEDGQDKFRPGVRLSPDGRDGVPCTPETLDAVGRYTAANIKGNARYYTADSEKNLPARIIRHDTALNDVDEAGEQAKRLANQLNDRFKGASR